MTVSAPTSSVDLDTIVTGGDAFLARMKALKDARAEHDEALANLRLGHDVVRAMQDVQVREQAVIDERASVKAEAEKIVADAKAEAEAMIAEAKADASRVIAAGEAEATKLTAEVNEAHAELGKWSADVKGRVLQMASVREASEKMQEAYESLHAKIVEITSGEA